ncbi:DUF982 domain-containing protein [Rhizobium sp. 2YAF20]|uniref:DUF982 domain-containing protein n=1 Tax=Rhizobium sp. 2YAF20 TaxID=3233027 RepID=UPI003F9C7A2B
MVPMRLRDVCGRLDAYLIVCSTKKAENILTYKWTVENGAERRQALEVCAEVMNGNLPPDEARHAFILATKEAGLVAADTPRQFAFAMPTGTETAGTSHYAKPGR